jgi:hypothetical protein
MTVIKDLIQGSPEWKLLRKGKPSSSNFSEVITSKTGELSKSASGYIRQLIADCFCPEYEGFSGNRYTEQGKLLEPEAREAFVKHTGLSVEQVGFCVADDNICGCSPDSLILSNGAYVAGLEIKVPMPKTHVGYVLDGGIPDEYRQQVHSSMAITGLRTWHFWSYFPGMKSHHHIAHWDEYTDKVAVAMQGFVAMYRTEFDRAIPLLKLS